VRRSNYSDECDDNWRYIMWRGRVASSTKGKRGQKMLKDLLAALDEMPVKRLIANELKNEEGFCTLGVLGNKRAIELDALDPTDSESVAACFDIAEPLAREIVYMNDEFCSDSSPEKRWETMHTWVKNQILAEV